MPDRAAVRDLAGRADVERLLRAFYARAFADPVLGPVFTRLDLEAHLPVIADFWERTLFGTGHYAGRAMAVHRALHGRTPLTGVHFERWLALWHHALDAGFAGPVTERARSQAERAAAAMLRQLERTEPCPPAAGGRTLPLLAP